MISLQLDTSTTSILMSNVAMLKDNRMHVCNLGEIDQTCYMYV